MYGVSVRERVARCHREDAEKAKDAVKIVGGRPVLLTYADRKPSKKSKRQKEVQEKEGSKKARSAKLQEKKEEESEDSDSEDYEELTSKPRTEKGQGWHMYYVVLQCFVVCQCICSFVLAKKPKRKKKAERAEPSFDVGRVVVVTGLPEQASEEQIRDHCRYAGVCLMLFCEESFVYS